MKEGHKGEKEKEREGKREEGKEKERKKSREEVWKGQKDGLVCRLLAMGLFA